MPLSPAAREVLLSATKVPDRLTITAGQLSRELYAEVNGALELLGGKWSTTHRAHLFRRPYLEQLAAILEGRAALPPKNPSAFFPTPETLALEILRASASLPQLPREARVLEPSAGQGALIRAALAVRSDLQFQACEIDPENRAALAALKIPLLAEDFLLLDEKAKYDAVILNPPFAVPGDKFAWLTHTEKALRLLKPKGTLIAILPQAIEYQSTQRIRTLRGIFLAGGRITPNPEKSFQTAGTAVRTVTAYFGRSERPQTQTETRERDAAHDFHSVLPALRLTPTSGSPDDIVAALEARGTVNARTVILPQVRSFSELCSNWGPFLRRDSSDRDPAERPSYCVASSTPLGASLSVTLRPEIWSLIRSKLVLQDDPGCFLEVISRSDGWSVVYFRHGKIIGDRIVAVIATRSLGAIPQPAALAA